jgi:hypothetical protein
MPKLLRDFVADPNDSRFYSPDVIEPDGYGNDRLMDGDYVDPYSPGFLGWPLPGKVHPQPKIENS